MLFSITGLSNTIWKTRKLSSPVTSQALFLIGFSRIFRWINCRNMMAITITDSLLIWLLNLMAGLFLTREQHFVFLIDNAAVE